MCTLHISQIPCIYYRMALTVFCIFPLVYANIQNGFSLLQHPHKLLILSLCDAVASKEHIELVHCALFPCCIFLIGNCAALFERVLIVNEF